MTNEEKELKKIEKEVEKEFEREQKRLAFEKMQLELNELKKSYWTRFVIPEIPKWVPAILIAAVSIYITFKSNIFKVQEDKAKIEQDKLVMERKKQAIEDTISTLTSNKFFLKDAIDKLKADTTRMRQKSDSIQIDIDVLKASLASENINKAHIYAEIQKLEKEKAGFIKEIMFAPFSVKFSLIRNDPNPNCDCVSEIIKHITNNGEFKNRLIDTLFEFRRMPRLFAISSLILQQGLNLEKYFNDILNEASYLINKYRDKTDLYEYKFIDSLDYIRFQSVYSVLSSNWTPNRKLIISELIIDSLFSHYVDNNIYNSFLNIPRVFNNNMNFDLLSLKPSLFLKYMKLNLNLAYADEKLAKNEFIYRGDTIIHNVFIYNDVSEKKLIDSPYFYNRFINKKTEFLINASFFCPQIFYSFITKYKNLMYTTRLNKKNTNSVEMKLYSQYSKDNPINFYPMLRSAYYAIDNNNYDEKIDNGPMEDSLQAVFESDSGLDVKGAVGKAFLIINKKYESNKLLIETWLDEDFTFHKNDLNLLATKIKTLKL